jgi:hypothetical protein
MPDVISSRTYLAKKKDDAFYYCQVTVTQEPRGFSVPASTTRYVPPAYLPKVPQSSWERRPIRFGNNLRASVVEYPIDQYMNWLWDQVFAQQAEEEQRKWNEKKKEFVNDVILILVFVALPELAPELKWFTRLLTVSEIAVSVAGEGIVAAAVETCVEKMVAGGYEVFADVSSGIVKKVIVNLTNSKLRKEVTVNLTTEVVKEVGISVKESLIESKEPAVPALKELERIHYILMEIDPSYPKRYAEAQAKLAQQRKPPLTPVTTYLYGF